MTTNKYGLSGKVLASHEEIRGGQLVRVIDQVEVGGVACVSAPAESLEYHHIPSAEVEIKTNSDGKKDIIIKPTGMAIAIVKWREWVASSIVQSVSGDWQESDILEILDAIAKGKGPTE